VHPRLADNDRTSFAQLGDDCGVLPGKVHAGGIGTRVARHVPCEVVVLDRHRHAVQRSAPTTLSDFAICRRSLVAGILGKAYEAFQLAIEHCDAVERVLDEIQACQFPQAKIGRQLRNGARDRIFAHGLTQSCWFVGTGEKTTAG
jgi:hypothetical protein